MIVREQRECLECIAYSLNLIVNSVIFQQPHDPTEAKSGPSRRSLVKPVCWYHRGITYTAVQTDPISKTEGSLGTANIFKFKFT